MDKKEEVVTRVSVAYEQLDRCHTMLCRSLPRNKDSDWLLDDFRSAMHYLLEIQVKLGVLKREEDL